MDIGRLNPGSRVSLFGRSEILPSSKYGLIPGIQYPASSVKEIFDYGQRTNANYLININGVSTSVYCDLTGQYTGDSSNGYMLFQTFGTSNNIGNAISAINITSTNYSSYGWEVYTDGSWVNSTNNLAGWYGGDPNGYLRRASLGFSSPTISAISIRWGNSHSAGGSRLYINGSVVQSASAGQVLTYNGPINPYTGSNIIQVDEFSVSIWRIDYIFVR